MVLDPAPPRPGSYDPGSHRLAPHALVLRREDDELQVGLEPSLVVPASYGSVLDLLTGGATEQALDIAARASGLAPSAAAELIVALDALGLLADGEVRPLASAAVRVIGASPLATQVALALGSAGVGLIYLADLPRRQPAPGSRPARTVDPVEILAARLASTHPEVQVRTTQHFAKPDTSVVALTVVVADGPEPDRLVTELLGQLDAAHLLVRCAGHEVTIGPLVVPGQTSCVRCADLARRDVDERWPWLLPQLSGVRLGPDPSLTGWAVATAVTQALAFLSDGTPETLDHTLELRAGEHTMRLRPWPVHPDCACRLVEAGPTLLWSQRGE